MKTLLIMRHAKSSWKEKKLTDIERPLKHRGEKDAEAMGQLLKKKGIVPDQIVSSPAIRARMTAEAVAKKSGYAKEIHYVDRLFMAEASQILEVLNNLAEPNETVLLVGHNPGLEYTVQLLSREIVPLPTATIAYLKVPVDLWKNLTSETECKLVKVWDPKE